MSTASLNWGVPATSPRGSRPSTGRRGSDLARWGARSLFDPLPRRPVRDRAPSIVHAGSPRRARPASRIAASMWTLRILFSYCTIRHRSSMTLRYLRPPYTFTIHRRLALRWRPDPRMFHFPRLFRKRAVKPRTSDRRVGTRNPPKVCRIVILYFCENSGANPQLALTFRSQPSIGRAHQRLTYPAHSSGRDART